EKLRGSCGCSVCTKCGLVYWLWRLRTGCRSTVVLDPVDLEDLELVDTAVPRVAVARATSDGLRQHPNVVALLKGFRHRLGVAGELKLKELAMRFCFTFGVVLPILGEAGPEVSPWPGVLGLGGKSADQFTAIGDHVGHRVPPPLLRGQL